MPLFDDPDAGEPAVSEEAVYRRYLELAAGITDRRTQDNLWAAERAKRAAWAQAWGARP